MIDKSFFQGSMFSQQYWGNTLGVYLEALAIIVGVMVGFWVFRKVVVAKIHKLAQKTQTDIDDFLLELLKRLGPLTYFLIGLYLASQSLVLSLGISRILTIVFVIFITFKVVQIFHALVVFNPAVGQIGIRKNQLLTIQAADSGGLNPHMLHHP